MEQLTICVSGPAELLAVLPYHLGFRPARSVVVVCLHAKQIGLVARLDLPPTSSAAREAADEVLPVLHREAPTGVMVIGYEDEVGQSTSLSDEIVSALAEARIPVVDRVVVRGDRWTGLLCSCCPDEPVPDPPDVGAVASYVGLGRRVLDSREDVARTIRPPEPAPAELARAIDDWVATVLDPGLLLAPLAPLAHGGPSAWPHMTHAELCLAAWGELLGGGLDDTDIGDELLCLLLGSLRHKGLRDGIIATLCPGSLSRDALHPRLADLLDVYVAPALDPDDEDDRDVLGPVGWGGEPGRLIGTRLQRLCRLAPDSHAAPVLAVTGALAWSGGDGVAARVAIERALEVEPTHVLAQLLGHLLETGVRPPGRAA